MVHGFTQIGIIRKGQKMEVQSWPNFTDMPILMLTIKKFKAKSWTVDYDMDGYYKRATIHVESVEIVYKGVGTENMLALQHVQGVSLTGNYFDEQHYPMHEYLNAHPMEPEPPAEDYSMLAQRLAMAMPGLNTPVPYPCDCKRQGDGSVWGVIQHLNDEHHPARSVADKWSRERIADWTEELPIDLTVDPGDLERRKRESQEQHELLKKYLAVPPINQDTLDKIVGIKGKGTT